MVKAYVEKSLMLCETLDSLMDFDIGSRLL